MFSFWPLTPTRSRSSSLLNDLLFWPNSSRGSVPGRSSGGKSLVSIFCWVTDCSDWNQALIEFNKCLFPAVWTQPNNIQTHQVLSRRGMKSVHHVFLWYLWFLKTLVQNIPTATWMWSDYLYFNVDWKQLQSLVLRKRLIFIFGDQERTWEWKEKQHSVATVEITSWVTHQSHQKHVYELLFVLKK